MANRVAELVASIASSTTEVNDYLTSHNISPLSFDADVPGPVQLDEKYAVSRDAAVHACSELQALLGGSSSSIFTTNVTDLVNLQAICRFNIATSFLTSKPTATYTELSDVTGVAEPDIRRIVRGALTNHVFQKKEPGVVSHTAASQFLASNEFARQWVEMTTEELLPAASRMVDAMERYTGSGEPNHVGYSLANGTSEHCFDYLAHDPVRAERFSDAMTLFSSGPGGSHGAYSIPLVRKFPKLRGIVQDRPEVVQLGSKNVPDDIVGRFEYMSHDFFDEQCVTADVYLLRWILHDWSDQYCVKILRALIPALRSGTRILLHEWIVPEPHCSSPHEQVSMRIFDLYMKALCNGKEREAKDWRDLVTIADPRFRIRAIAHIPTSKLGIVDIEWIE